jgi:hypothetical protein
VISAGAARPPATDQRATNPRRPLSAAPSSAPRSQGGTAYLGITIRRDKNQDKAGAKSIGPSAVLVDLEKVI